GARAGGEDVAGDADDLPVGDLDVHDPGARAAGDGYALDQPLIAHRHASSPAPPSSRYRTAIRTMTPLLTCATIVDRGESATSAAISTPGFIGPGCMTMAWSGSSAIRPASSP